MAKGGDKSALVGKLTSFWMGNWIDLDMGEYPLMWDPPHPEEILASLALGLDILATIKQDRVVNSSGSDMVNFYRTEGRHNKNWNDLNLM